MSHKAVTCWILSGSRLSVATEVTPCFTVSHHCCTTVSKWVPLRYPKWLLCSSTLWFNIHGLTSAGEMFRRMVNSQYNKAALSSSRVLSFNEGRRPFVLWLKFCHSHPQSLLSMPASLEGALWKAIGWSARRLDPVASAWEQECC